MQSPILPDAKIQPDMITASETAESQLEDIEAQLATCAAEDPARYRLSLDKARILTELDRKAEAWGLAREVFDHYMAEGNYEGAVDACDTLFLCEQEESLAALGMGIWLGVTYPIDPELSIGILQHVIDETTEDADGAAVAAVTAHYLADLRSPPERREDLLFFTNQMLGNVARRHSQIESQQQFDLWLQKLELDDPAKFLVRLRNVVDVLVQDNWWFDRDELQAQLPD